MHVRRKTLFLQKKCCIYIYNLYKLTKYQVPCLNPASGYSTSEAFLPHGRRWQPGIQSGVPRTRPSLGRRPTAQRAIWRWGPSQSVMNFWVIGIFVSLISGVPPESPEHHQHEIICTNLCWHPLSPRGTGVIQDLYIYQVLHPRATCVHTNSGQHPCAISPAGSRRKRNTVHRRLVWSSDMAALAISKGVVRQTSSLTPRLAFFKHSSTWMWRLSWKPTWK